MIRTMLLGLGAGVFLALSGAASADITYEGGDGTSIAAAVIIAGAEGAPDGVTAEYRWIAENRPGAEVLGQALAQDGDRIYDVLTIRVGGRQEEIFFDITDFFGKF
jgi:hypothetical protein